MNARKVSRKVVIFVSVPLLIVAVLVGWWAAEQYKFQRARENWKNATLRQLTETSLTNEQIRVELDQIRNPTPNLNFGWAHDHVILMTNGQYLVYAFWHGFNSGAVDHLFLARGTDGKWYYSTYHFCSHMAGILGDDPAGSLGEFVSRYSLREFDGKSDECLKHTWPPKR
jgi:hypothetical protein